MPQNNTWISSTSSRTVVVFVHGILSDSNAWRNKKAGTYWPKMVADDPQFEGVSVFVSGYTAGLGAGLYDVYAAANDVLAHLRTPAAPPSPLEKDRILFICHSQGGIVVRQMLTTHFEEFAKKKVGVILCGSPSWGSHYGTLFAPLTLLLRFRQGTALSWGASTLRNLDREFTKLIEVKRIPQLTGLALVETRGRFLGIPIAKVVPEVSATRYFSWQPVPSATHQSLVKPDSRSHGSYSQTRDFAYSHGFLTKKPFKAALDHVIRQMTLVERAFDPNRPDSPDGKAESYAPLFEKMRAADELRDRYDRLPEPAFQDLLDADVAADQAWAFDKFSRNQFSDLKDKLLKTLAEV